MMELADMRDLGRVTLVKDFQGVQLSYIIIKTAGAWHRLIYAGVVELVDSKDLGSFVERRAGSSPAARTKPK